MREKSLLYFALGVTAVLSLGATANQVSRGSTSGVAIGDNGITFPDGSVQTTAASADPRRVFYLTDSFHQGNAALMACAAGFHMASMWEILDVSNLRYATDAEGNGDVFHLVGAAVGPPIEEFGWVRTGGASFNLDVVGLSNCSWWTSNLDTDYGSGVELDRQWDDVGTLLGPWDALSTTCQQDLHVWCIED